VLAGLLLPHLFLLKRIGPTTVPASGICPTYSTPSGRFLPPPWLIGQGSCPLALGWPGPYDRVVLDDIDHIGIAVSDLVAEEERYRRAFGLEPVHRETVEDQGVEEVMFRVGSSFIQLLRALGPETPVGKFLAARGPGVHHVGYRVSDVAATLERLKELGVRLVDEEPRPGSRGTTVAFVHPKGFGGVLVELVQEP
jgi:methylmalonyl-CoA/ethylmalonyl-CoA epimerase